MAGLITFPIVLTFGLNDAISESTVGALFISIPTGLGSYGAVGRIVATILPTAPYEPRPVGIDINNAPTVDSEIASFKPNVKTIGKVISPAIRPTKVSNDATPTLSFGRLL